jgi:HAE1 family hydrophobic/amphiphilic exporter-1
VTIEDARGPSSIARLNRQRVVTISSSLPQNASESDALAKLQQYVEQLNLPAEYSSGVQGQSKELQKAYGSFLYAFLLSFVFMYLILAAQFESFIHPVTILLTLPLSVPFALLSTAIAGQTLNIFSALGILLLFGIVKKNAILQIDHTNTLRAKGMSRYDRTRRGNDPAHRRKRCRGGDESIDRNPCSWRTVAMFAADSVGGSGILFALRRCR